MTRLNSIPAAFWLQAIERGDLPALFIGGDDQPTESLTWAQLAGIVAQVCDLLEQSGICAGDTVASWMPNSLSWIALDLACQSVGVCHAAIDFREPAPAAKQMARSVEARALFDLHDVNCELNFRIDDPCGEVHYASVDCASPLPMDQLRRRIALAHGQFASSSPAQILFTSGSTGERKAVMLSEANLFSNALAKLDAAPQRKSDLRLNILPFTHAYARTCELSTWVLSGCQFAMATGWESFVTRAAQLRPTLVNCVPFLAQRIADLLQQSPSALGGRLRLLQVGGAALPEALFRRLSKSGLPPICGYGMTETSPVVCSGRAGLQQPGTIGYPVSGVDIRVDANSRLFVRGTGVMLGYHRGDSRSPVDEDGWLATGDLAAIRGDGQVKILGRESQQIVLSTGYKVDPGLIESRLILSGVVRHCLVLGEGESCITAMVSFLDKHAGGDVNSFEASAGRLTSQFTKLFADLPRHAVPARVEPFPFQIGSESELLTAKGTLRRNRVLEALRGS
ncbi:MAG: long-chain fatty acid--CoA ligase [Aureliella sp.]